MSDFNLLKCSHFLNCFELLGNRKKPKLIFPVSVYNQLQNKNHRCQCKQMYGNYFRITTALCHLTAVYDKTCELQLALCMVWLTRVLSIFKATLIIDKLTETISCKETLLLGIGFRSSLFTISQTLYQTAITECVFCWVGWLQDRGEVAVVILL